MAMVAPPTPSQSSGVLRDLLANPLPFGPPLEKGAFELEMGMRVVEPGPPSPRPSSSGRTLLPNGHSALNGHGPKKPASPSSSRVTTPPPTSTPSSSKITLPTSATPTPTPTPTRKGKGKEPDHTHPSSSPSASSSATPRKSERSLHPVDVDLAWPRLPSLKAAGLNNPSMTCYANATLQVLLHTPPVLNVAISHRADDCIQLDKKGFCMLCVLREMAFERHWTKGVRSYMPKEVYSKLSLIKKGFSRTRQEDTHEFFRFVTDAFQASALAPYPKDLPEKVKHTSWVYRTWGGRVRSRVVCSRCTKPSDTFDDFLDLSLDVNHGKKSLVGMLQGFVREDKLDGDNKYHCENCKAKSVATKSFKIDKAPPILTFHLKRFSVNYSSYNGKAHANKFNQYIQYERAIDIAPFMVDRNAQGTRYKLFGVTCHQGSELRYGHYTSYVRGPGGQWFAADDEDVTQVSIDQVLGAKTAYLLSYIRDDGAADSDATPRKPALVQMNGSEVKRKRSAEDQDDGDGEREKKPKFADTPSPPRMPQSTPQATPPSDDRPSRFTYKPPAKSYNSSFSETPDIRHPRPHDAMDFSSPIARPGNPSPGRSLGGGEGSSKWLPGSSRFSPAGKKGKHRRERERDSRASGAPMPFHHGRSGGAGGKRGGGGGSGGWGGKSRGMISRMRGRGI